MIQRRKGAKEIKEQGTERRNPENGGGGVQIKTGGIDACFIHSLLTLL